jgi:hypothetical protein
MSEVGHAVEPLKRRNRRVRYFARSANCGRHGPATAPIQLHLPANRRESCGGSLIPEIAVG